jgi:hypothetical protein
MLNNYDTLIFGNGMTINLLGQLKGIIPIENHYLLSFNEFMIAFINDRLPQLYDEHIYRVLYKQNNKGYQSKYKFIKTEFKKFYNNGETNFEYYIGKNIFDKQIELSDTYIRSLYPALFNIWLDILYNYISINYKPQISCFYKSVKDSLNCKNYLSTNFDYLADRYINVEHLHGKMKKIGMFNDVVLKMDKKNTYYKTVWGHNGIGKLNTIIEYAKEKNCSAYFDFDFFLNDKNYNNVLIYGMSFQRAGYITDDFISEFPDYENSNYIGTCIDDHIVIRLKALQDMNLVNKVSVCYHNETSYEHLNGLFIESGIKNLDFIKSSEFNYNIN